MPKDNSWNDWYEIGEVVLPSGRRKSAYWKERGGLVSVANPILEDNIIAKRVRTSAEAYNIAAEWAAHHFGY